MNRPRNLSKSKIVAYRQCPKRLWLEVHHPELRVDDANTQAVFRTGHQVGEIAQQIYDPDNKGHIINIDAEGFSNALKRSKHLMQGEGPVFEAGFVGGGGLAFADVMLRSDDAAGPSWRMVEVKSSTSVKSYQSEDATIQTHIASEAGVRLNGVAIAHINSSWTYQGDGDYRGLLIEQDLTDAALEQSPEAGEWIRAAHEVARLPEAPEIEMGVQCRNPFTCGFIEHCSAHLPHTDYPIDWLPGRKSAALQDHITDNGIIDLRDVPDELLNETQRRVKRVTLTGEPYFDAEGAAAALAPYPLPAYFLDFETISFGVPRWAGTRPYQMIPFQFSVHRLDPDGTLSHDGFLDLSGDDPSLAFASRLIQTCNEELPIFVYNASFEGSRLVDLGMRYPELAEALNAIKDRLVDLLPIAQRHYYHPNQKGSWSIKYVLPAVAPHLDYGTLPGVHDGAQAMETYLDAIEPETPPDRKLEIQNALEKYCELDTEAMVELWHFFAAA